MPTQPAVRTRFQLVENLIYLPIKANGHAMHFLLDTGASATVIDHAKAKAVGLTLSEPPIRGGGGGEQAVAAVPVRLRELIVGNETARDVTVYAIPLTGIAEALGVPVDGVLGFDFLSRYALEVDYLAKYVTFHPNDEYNTYTGPGEVVPFTLEHNHIQVQADVRRPGSETIRGKFTVDLGMSFSVILNAPFVKTHKLLDAESASRASSLGVGVGGGSRGVVGRLSSLKLGSFMLKEPPTVYSLATGGYFASDERAGNLGAEILSRFHVVVDYPRNRLILEKNANFDTPFEEDASGLMLVAKGPAFQSLKVHNVEKGSAAAEAGVQEADLILSIDSLEASKKTLAEWRREFRRAGETRRLVLKRGNDEVRVEIVLRRHP